MWIILVKAIGFLLALQLIPLLWAGYSFVKIIMKDDWQ